MTAILCSAVALLVGDVAALITPHLHRARHTSSFVRTHRPRVRLHH